jgi:hypothetical protein
MNYVKLQDFNGVNKISFNQESGSPNNQISIILTNHQINLTPDFDALNSVEDFLAALQRLKGTDTATRNKTRTFMSQIGSIIHLFC